MKAGEWTAYKLPNGYENCGRITKIFNNGAVRIYSYRFRKSFRCHHNDCYFPKEFTDWQRCEVMCETKQAMEEQYPGQDWSRLF